MKRIWCLPFLAAVSLNAQHVITVDWSDKTLSNAPTKIDSSTPIKLRVVKINDFLYTYEAKIKYEPRVEPAVSLDELVMLTGAIASESIIDCTAITDHLTKVTKLAGPFELQPGPGGVYPSKSLSESLADWARLEPEFFAAESATQADRKCDSYVAYTRSLQPKLRELSRISKGSHEFLSDHVLPGDGVYTIDVKELYKNTVTAGGAYTAKFEATSSIFFLTVGYLASQVQSRSYDAVDVATDRKELRIQGTGSWRPNAALLLNYKVPISSLSGDKFGVAIAAGPVFRAISSQTGNTATNVGVFGGLSFYFWNRLSLTPGFHIGEFADMPLGFDNTRDRTVPAGIQNPITGVNRWTARLGIGVTFSVADFKKAASAVSLKKTPAEGAPAGGAEAEVKKAQAERDAAQKALEAAEAEAKKATTDQEKANASTQVSNAKKALAAAEKKLEDAKAAVAKRAQ